MRPINKKVMTGAIAAAVIFSGAGLVHTQVFAAASATDQAQSGTEQQVKPEGKGMRGGFHGEGMRGGFAGFRGGDLLQEAASVLGVEETALREQLQQGQTLVQIAAAQGLSEEDFLSKLAALETASIDAAIASGKLTQEQADSLKSGLSERLKQQIEGAGPAGELKDGRGGKGGPGGGMDRSRYVSGQDLAAILGMTEEELRTEQEAGKSLAEIAEAKGIAEEDLIAKIKDSMSDELKSFVERKGGPEQRPGKDRADRPAPSEPSAAPTSTDAVLQ